MTTRARWGRVAWPCFLVALLTVSCNGRTTDPRGEDVPPVGGDGAVTLLLRAPMSIVAVGQTTRLEVEARSESGEPVDADGATFSFQPSGIVEPDGETVLLAIAEGEVTVTAMLGDLVSEPVELRVVALSEVGEPSIRLSPSRVVLAPDGVARLSVTVRDGFGQRVPEPHVTLEVADEAVAMAEDDVSLRAVADGSTTVRAMYDGFWSPPVDVAVVDGDYVAVDWLEPTGVVTAVDSLSVSVTVQTLTAGSPSEFGLPVAPSSVEVWADGEAFGTLTPHFGGADGSVPVSGLGVGNHALRVRAEVEGDVYESPPLTVHVAPATDVFEALGEPAAGDQGDLLVLDGSVYRVANDCTRECRISVARWDDAEGSWVDQSYQQREWDAVGDWQEPTGYTEDIRTTANLSLPRFQGWGWPPRGARDPYFGVVDGALTVFWANQEARTAFNLEDMPERYWYDCYGARWDASAGFDGAGGYELLGESGTDYLSDLPHPDEIGVRDEYQFPAGADASRAYDCAMPRHVSLGGDSGLLYLSGPVPGEERTLELRRWSGDSWTDEGPAYELSGFELPRLRASARDQAGGVVAAVRDDRGHAAVLRFDAGDWSTIEDGTRAIDALAVAGDELLAVGLASGDARVHAWRSGRWSQLGLVLDVDVWAEVAEVALAVNGDTRVVVWTEGPEVGNRTLHVARWDEEMASWRQLVSGPVDAQPDRRATRPRVAFDEGGRLLVLYTEWAEGADDPFVQRVLRSREPL